MESHVSVVSYGASGLDVVSQMSSYWGFICLFPLIYLLARKLLPMTANTESGLAASDSDAAQPAKGQ